MQTQRSGVDKPFAQTGPRTFLVECSNTFLLVHLSICTYFQPLFDVCSCLLHRHGIRRWIFYFKGGCLVNFHLAWEWWWARRSGVPVITDQSKATFPVDVCENRPMFRRIVNCSRKSKCIFILHLKYFFNISGL